jgi:hypothetical protein
LQTIGIGMIRGSIGGQALAFCVVMPSGRGGPHGRGEVRLHRRAGLAGHPVASGTDALGHVRALGARDSERERNDDHERDRRDRAQRHPHEQSFDDGLALSLACGLARRRLGGLRQGAFEYRLVLAGAELPRCLHRRMSAGRIHSHRWKAQP